MSTAFTRTAFKSTLLNILTWVLVLVFVFPVFWMVINGFKTEEVASNVNPTLIFTPTLDAFHTMMERGMGNYLRNSFMASVGSTIVVLILAVPAAYALSVRPVKAVGNSLSFFISTRFMPVAASILPLYMILKSIGGLDNIWFLIAVYAGINLPITVWMMRSFFMEIPREVIEAAQLDGAGLFTELVRVVLPLVLPGIAAAGLIGVIFAWNEYFMANLLTSNVAKTTPPFLASFVDGRGQFLAVLSAAATVAAMPVIIAGWVAQKQLVRGLSMGAIK